MKDILNKYLNEEQIYKIKEKRFHKVNKLVLFLKGKNINFSLNKNLFFNKKSYLAYALLAYVDIIEKIKAFTNDKIQYKELRKSIEIISQNLNSIENKKNLIIINYQTKEFVDNLFLDAFKLLQQTSFNDREKFIGCIAILKHVEGKGIIQNYTEDFHINTIFADYVINDRIQNAEILVHETSHLYFNYFLESNNINLDISKLYLYAPWKSEIKRHERGFLHGVFAFSNVLAFYMELKDNFIKLSPKEKELVNYYVDFRRQQIMQVKNDALKVIKKYPKNLQNIIIDILKKIDN